MFLDSAYKPPLSRFIMSRTNMLAEERRARILEVLDARGSVSVTELHRQLNVSRETIRRDITQLSNENRLRKTHGGALSQTSWEPSLTERLSVNIDGKRRIAEAAAELIPDGSSVIIDSGSTTQCLADSLASHRDLTVYTNDLQVAAKLYGRNGHRVYMIGGELNENEGSTFGPDAITMLSTYFTDFAFLGVSAISQHAWMTDYSRNASELRGTMIEHAKTSVLLADKSKFNVTASVRVQNTEKASMMITDTDPGEKIQHTLNGLGIELRIVTAG